MQKGMSARKDDIVSKYIRGPGVFNLQQIIPWLFVSAASSLFISLRVYVINEDRSSIKTKVMIKQNAC